MDDSARPPILPLLQGAACTVIILGAVKLASPIVGPLLLALLLAYAVTPFPNWLMRRLKLSKNAAIAMTAVAAGAFTLYLVLAVDVATVRIAAKLPVYEQRLASLYDQIAGFMNANGIVAPTLSVKSVLTPERLREISRVALPEAGEVISNGLLISLLGFLFVIEMAEQIGVKRGPIVERLIYYGSESRDLLYAKALALALVGETAKPQSLADDLAKSFPDDTTVRFNYLPALRAQLALNRRDPGGAIESLQLISSHELMIPGGPTVDLAMLPVFVRGRAHLEAHQGNEAAVEFQKILDRPGLLAFSPIRALANLYLARAYAMQTHPLAGPEADAARAKARAAYEGFLTLWKDADPNVPVLKEAKAEYAKLQ